jgi:hypothetical protein
MQTRVTCIAQNHLQSHCEIEMGSLKLALPDDIWMPKKITPMETQTCPDSHRTLIKKDFPQTPLTEAELSEHLQERGRWSFCPHQ